jgi:hypothetical protein
MQNDRSHDAHEQPVTATIGDVDAVSTLVRTYACRPPYDAVDWDAVAARILSAADAELGRRRTLAGRAGALRWRVRAWWEVTAGWARPAVAAAVAMIAVATALVIANPGTTPVADAASTAEMTATADGVDAVMLGSPATEAAFTEAGPITRDSLFSAVVDGR